MSRPHQKREKAMFYITYRNHRGEIKTTFTNDPDHEISFLVDFIRARVLAVGTK